MTWTVTLDSGDQNVVLPNGIRYQGSASAVLSDEWYSQLSASAVSALLAASYLGGVASYTVTVASGVVGAVLPDGLPHGAGDVVTLADEEYSLLTPLALSALIFSVSVAVS